MIEGKIALPSIAPGETGSIDLSSAVWEQLSTYETIVTVSLRLAKTTNWTEQGHEVGWFQKQLSPACNLHIPVFPRCPSPVIHRTHSAIIVATAKSTFAFSRARGSLISWTTPQGSITAPSQTHANNLTPSFWRPPTDNDAPKALPHWRSFGMDKMTSQLRSMNLNEKTSSNTIAITTQTYLAPPSLGWGWHATTTYKIQPNGSAVSVFVQLHDPTGNAIPEYLPRLGIDVSIAKTINNVTWSGRGPGESYPDKKNSQKLGIWHVDDISELQTPYEVPQENGNRTDTRWVELVSKETGLSIHVSRMVSSSASTHSRTDKETSDSTLTETSLFNFTATRHSATTIENAPHPYDLVEDDFTTLRLDAAVSGVGTAACGPGPREDHLVRPDGTSFGFMLTLR